MMCFCSAGCEITIPSAECVWTQQRGCSAAPWQRSPVIYIICFFLAPRRFLCGTRTGDVCAAESTAQNDWLWKCLLKEISLRAAHYTKDGWMLGPTHPRKHAAWNETAAAAAGSHEFLFWNYGHNLTLQKRSHHIFPIVIGQCQQGVCPLLRAKYCSRCCKRASLENYLMPRAICWEYYYLVALLWSWPGLVNSYTKTSKSISALFIKKNPSFPSCCWLLGQKF
jgi:hypothetical protein